MIELTHGQLCEIEDRAREIARNLDEQDKPAVDSAAFLTLARAANNCAEIVERIVFP